MNDAGPNGHSDAASYGETEPRRIDAEQIAADWAERIGRWALRTAARTREEAEDIWAEAQDLRRRL